MRSWFLLLFAMAASAAPLPSHPKLLFDAAGIEQLKLRIQKTPWSSQWQSFRSGYDSTLGQPVVLPPRGSNWFHWYVCPKHGARLTTGKKIGDWQWEHICPVDQEVLRGDPARPETDFDGCALSGPHDRYARAVRDGGILFQVTGDAKYAARVRDILLAYAARYLEYPLHDTKGQAKIGGGRVGPQTLDEAVWLIPMAQGADLIWDTLPAAERQTVSEKLFLPSARDVILVHKMGIHNIQNWKNSAVGLTGFLLGDETLQKAAIDDPDRGYRAQMARGVQADGVWFEGAWGYHFYTLSAIWPLTEAARNHGIDLYGDPLRKMFEAPVKLAMPNLMLPAFNDSAETPVRNNLYELAYARYHDPIYLKALAGSNRRNETALWFGVEQLASDEGKPLGSRQFPESGYAILERAGTWLCLKFGPHGGGHGHPDKNNFILYGDGKVLMPDPGTRPYGSPIHTEWDRATLGHNTLVVDEMSQAAATGKLLASGTENGADYATSDAGNIYPGVRFVRTVLLVNPKLVVFVDRVTADRPHTLDLAAHFAGAWRGVTGETATLPSKGGYQYLRDAKSRKTGEGATLALDWGGTVTLAAGESTEVIAATGVGKSTEDRVPMTIFRRTAKETTFVWAVSLEGAAKLSVEGESVRVNGAAFKIPRF